MYYLPTASSLENDFTPPTIDYSEASSSTSSLGFEVQVTPSAAPVDGVLVLYTDATTPGTWTGVDLSSTNGGQTWTGTGSPAPSGQVQYLVEAVDAAGNVAVSNNEGTDFNGAPAPSSISITLSGSGPTNGYYTSATVTADITAPSGSTYELDGSQSNSVPADGVVQVTGTGEHTITVTDPAGGTDTEEFAISTSETTVSLASSANPSAVGQTVTFNATVSPLTAGVGTPTGFVEFLDGGAALSGCGGTAGTTVSTSGVATCAVTYSSPSILPHTITAIYLGDSNFSESTSSTLNQTVDQAETTTTLSASPDPAVVGQPITFTATVSVAAPGSGTPTGSRRVLRRRGCDLGLRSSDSQQRGHSHLPGHLHLGRQSHDHRCLRRWRQLRHVDLVGTDPEGQPSRDDDHTVLLGQPVGGRPTDHLHGHGERRGPWFGDTHGVCRVLRRRGCDLGLRSSDSQQRGHSHLPGHLHLGRQSHDHRCLRRWRRLRHVDLVGTDPEGQPSRHDDFSEALNFRGYLRKRAVSHVHLNGQPAVVGYAERQDHDRVRVDGPLHYHAALEHLYFHHLYARASSIGESLLDHGRLRW